MSVKSTFVIVGAGLAGAKAAETLRSQGFDGRIVLIGDETARPYERPPLSKDYLRGEKGFEAAAVHEEGYCDAHGIELFTSTLAESIDPKTSEVVLSTGKRLSNGCCSPPGRHPGGWRSRERNWWACTTSGGWRTPTGCGRRCAASPGSSSSGRAGSDWR